MAIGSLEGLEVLLPIVAGVVVGGGEGGRT